MSMTIFAQCSVTHLYLFFIEKKQFACISANSRKIHNKMVDFSILEGKDPWEVGTNVCRFRLSTSCIKTCLKY